MLAFKALKVFQQSRFRILPKPAIGVAEGII
jgi:hypothetical protein